MQAQNEANEKSAKERTIHLIEDQKMSRDYLEKMIENKYQSFLIEI